MKKTLFFLILISVSLLFNSCDPYPVKQKPFINIIEEKFLPESRTLKVGETINIYLSLKKTEDFNYSNSYNLILKDNESISFEDFEIHELKAGRFLIHDKYINFSFKNNNNIDELHFTLSPKKAGNYKFKLNIRGKSESLLQSFKYDPDYVSYEKELEFIVTE